MSNKSWKSVISPLLPEMAGMAIERLTQHECRTVEEIRVRAGKPIQIIGNGWEKIEPSILPTADDCAQVLAKITNHSLYAFEEEIKKGFVTLKGGFRVGVCGRALVSSGEIECLNYCSGFNFRISREVIGCADKVLPFVADNSRIFNTLVISGPGCGKTTLLRDLARQISNGVNCQPQKVCIADERSEIAGCLMGIAQNDVGMRTDVFDACPKGLGIEIMLRAMSPDVIVTDELGNDDEKAIILAANSGVTLLASAHGHGIEDMNRRPVLCSLFNHAIFERIIVLRRLQRPGEIFGIYNERLRRLDML